MHRWQHRSFRSPSGSSGCQSGCCSHEDASTIQVAKHTVYSTGHTSRKNNRIELFVRHILNQRVCSLSHQLSSQQPTITVPRAHFTAFVLSTEATVTSTFALRRTSMTPTASSSSEPSEIATSARGIEVENYTSSQHAGFTLRMNCLASIK